MINTPDKIVLEGILQEIKFLPEYHFRKMISSGGWAYHGPFHREERRYGLDDYKYFNLAGESRLDIDNWYYIYNRPNFEPILFISTNRFFLTNLIKANYLKAGVILLEAEEHEDTLILRFENEVLEFKSLDILISYYQAYIDSICAGNKSIIPSLKDLKDVEDIKDGVITFKKYPYFLEDQEYDEFFIPDMVTLCSGTLKLMEGNFKIYCLERRKIYYDIPRTRNNNIHVGGIIYRQGF